MLSLNLLLEWLCNLNQSCRAGRAWQTSFLAHDPNRPRNGPNRHPTLAIPSPATCSCLCFKGRRVSGTWRPCREHPPPLLPPPSRFFLGLRMWRSTRAAPPSSSTPSTISHVASHSSAPQNRHHRHGLHTEQQSPSWPLHVSGVPWSASVWVCLTPVKPRRHSISLSLVMFSRHVRSLLVSLGRRGTSGSNKKQLRVPDAKLRRIWIVFVDYGVILRKARVPGARSVFLFFCFCIFHGWTLEMHSNSKISRKIANVDFFESLRNSLCSRSIIYHVFVWSFNGKNRSVEFGFNCLLYLSFS